ncbi:RnfABCDGE type electron transport complex subunit D [Treponema sp. R6D11]
MLKVSSSPHIKNAASTRSIMLDVIIALFPCMIAGLYFFGYRAGVIIAISVASSYSFEAIWCAIGGQENSANDLSCIVSGVILALNLPSTVPLWLPVVASLFMIIIVKMLFGGLGQNFVNPAGAGRLFLTFSFPRFMTSFVTPYTYLHLNAANAITSATPLSLYKQAGEMAPIMNSFFGSTAGCIGETSAIAILLGFLYLVIRKVIKIDIPVIYVGVVCVLTAIIGKPVLFYALSGGLLFGAVFMATDYVTAPITRYGRWIYAALLGVMTFLLRFYSSFPEGVVMSIVFTNCLVPLIDKWAKPRRFGT